MSTNQGDPIVHEPCIGLAVAGQIVQNAIPGGPHKFTKTLREVGVFTPDQMQVFRQHCHDGVLESGCSIEIDDIPSDPDSTLNDVRNAISDKAQ